MQHGVPLQWRFEQGAWRSNLVKHAVKAMGSHLHTVWSPHQKPYIEGLFNCLWTKLSVQFPGCDVGRFRGETEEANRLLTACKAGHQDPRKYFPMLRDAVGAFTAVIDERNATPVESEIGRWVPAEAWEARPFERIRRLDPDGLWVFAPYVREWTVRGMLVGGRVPLFEDLSVPFDFSAPWLCEFDGARVRCHFDARDPVCFATVVLLQNWGTHKAGEVLGQAKQINEVAGYARLVLGWADDPQNAGRVARQQAAAGLRRELRGIVPTGSSAGRAKGLAVSEERDGINQVTRIETGEQGATGSGREGESSFVPRGGTMEEGEYDPGASEENRERLRRCQEFEEENLL
jgi:hypothetical protein